MTITSEFNVWDNVYCMQNNKPIACVIVAVHFPIVYHNTSDLDSNVSYKLLTKEEYDWRKDNSVAMSNDEGAFIVPACMVASSAKELLLRMLNEYDKKETNVKWYVAIDDYGIYESIMSQVPIFHKGEMTTKEKVYTYFPNMTDEEFNKHFRPATEEEIPLKKTLVEVYQASVDSATKEPEQPKDEIPQKTKFKVGDHIKSDVLTPRKGIVTKVNNGWYILDGRYVLNFEYEDNWELVESKPEPKERKVSGVLKKMLDNLDEESLAKTREEMLEETELTDFEKVLAECIHRAQGSVLSPEGVAITWSDALMAEAKKQIASELESIVDTMVSQNGGMCVHYREGIEDVINKIKGESV